MISRWIKVFIWIVALGLLFNMWFGGEVEDEPVLEIDFDKVVDYSAFEREKEELEREGKILHYSMVIDDQAEQEEIKETVKVLVNSVREETKFNALTVELYDHEKYVDRIEATLGTAIYAPEGRIDLADTVPAGTYREMDFSWDVLKKDWNRRPEKYEIDIWAEWRDTYDRLQDINDEGLYGQALRIENELVPALHPREEISSRSIDFMIGKRFDLSLEEVAEIRDKQLRWQLLDIQD